MEDQLWSVEQLHKTNNIKAQTSQLLAIDRSLEIFFKVFGYSSILIEKSIFQTQPNQTCIELWGYVQTDAHNVICILCFSCAQSTII